MNYTLNQLRIFKKVVELKSITKASEALFLTQPAVSIQLKKFQDQFDIPLTEVVGRQLFITTFGHEIASAADKILQEVKEIEYLSTIHEGKLAGKLSISVVSTGKYVMPYFLSDFMSAHPGIDLVMDVTNKLKVVQHLEKNEVDFALVSVIPEHLDLESLPLMSNVLHLVGNADTERDRTCSVEEIFTTYPMLFREFGSATRNAMEDFISAKEFKADKRIELTSNEALKQSVLAGLGYSIMPLIGLKNALQNNEIKIISYPNLPIVTTWNLVWLKAKKLSPVSREFLKYIQSDKEQIMTKYFDWIKKYV
ncbi:MAG: LysR family transcriptional regulator [bacterium]